MNLKGFADIFALLYNDKMDITSAVEDSSGVGDNIYYPAEPAQVGVPCRLSFSGKDVVSRGNETHEEVSLNPVIFCKPEVEVHAGDRIKVSRCHADGEVYDTFNGTVITSGRPNRWDNHQEISLLLEGDA